MSVVAVRDGMMAADTQASGGGIKFGMRKTACQDGVAIGWAGTWVDGKTFAEWYFKGADISSPPVYHGRHGDQDRADFAAIVLKPDSWEYWCEYLVPELSTDIHMPFYAIGSGAQAALAAMHLGATAIEAVEVACKVADGCSLPIEHHGIGAA